MFDDLFRYYLSATFPNGYKITSIKVDQGMVVAKTEPNGPYTRPYLQPSVSHHQDLTVLSFKTAGGFTDASAADWRPFPTAVASTPDQATAVMMHGQCHVPLGDARTLFEMLIRRKSPIWQLMIIVSY